MIRLCTTKNVAFNISKETTTSDLMLALARCYEKPSKSNRIFFLQKLFNLRMGDASSVANHLNEFNSI